MKETEPHVIFEPGTDLVASRVQERMDDSAKDFIRMSPYFCNMWSDRGNHRACCNRYVQRGWPEVVTCCLPVLCMMHTM